MPIKTMKNSSRRLTQMRTELAKEAARLMYEEEVKQYHDAKRLAAKRILGRSGKRRICFRPQHLPSNGEISLEVAKLADLYEGDKRTQLLFAMRIIALEVMDELKSFFPRLIGSVSTGRARRGSDIDLHVFADSLEPLVQKIYFLQWPYEAKQVIIRSGAAIREYTHLLITREFPVELSVYPLRELKVTGRSSTDGKPIQRLKPTALQNLIMEEHPEYWEHYLSTQEVVGLD